jgi:hypothetical protein
MSVTAGQIREVAAIVSEYWRLIRSFERAIPSTAPDAQGRLTAQVRYSEGRLRQLTQDLGLRLVTFDGVVFEPNLPAVAINADEFASVETLVVERTIEPAVIQDTKVILMGRVYLSKPDSEIGGIRDVSGH